MMWIAFYNQAVGDALMLTNGNNAAEVTVETKDNVTFIRDKKSKALAAINIFGVQDYLQFEDNGPQTLSDDQIAWVHAQLTRAGMTEELNITPAQDNLVVGYVEKCFPHQDSDHLSVTITNVGDEHLQIVCGAKNIREGLTVLVAKPGSVMPNGMMIWLGELRGVESKGMICSTRELGLTDIQDRPGIWELEERFRPGTLLSEVVETFRA